ncbi:hypothetical protein [Rhizobium sp. GCM10022189]|uniref:hypothetical protein n=1 Tax=Rhizobium sp. GCM10022189 TaxID=3252654 RepID=UPI0036186EE3
MSNWLFPPVPVFFALFGLWMIYSGWGKHWSVAFSTNLVLPYFYGNIFVANFSRTPASMFIAVFLTMIPCLWAAFYLVLKLKVAVLRNAEFSDTKSFFRAAGFFLSAAIVTYAAAFVPSTCQNAKCETGVSLFGPLDYSVVWAVCMWSGSLASGSVLLFFDIVRRRFNFR